MFGALGRSGFAGCQSARRGLGFMVSGFSLGHFQVVFTVLGAL